MTKIIICGASGRMGKVIAGVAKNKSDVKIVAGVDAFPIENPDFPIYKTFEEINETADVIIDFSLPTSLDSVLQYAIIKKLPVVLCVTGYSDMDIKKINLASEKIAVFRSSNMSIGINLLIELCQRAAKLLPEFDIELIEKHHNMKYDAPSGTALSIADAIKEAKTSEVDYTFGRHAQHKRREKSELGIHSIRGGTIVGEHEVEFIGHNEILTITHKAESREVFANGAVYAGIFMNGKTKGMYDMQDLIAAVK